MSPALQKHQIWGWGQVIGNSRSPDQLISCAHAGRVFTLSISSWIIYYHIWTTCIVYFNMKMSLTGPKLAMLHSSSCDNKWMMNNILLDLKQILFYTLQKLVSIFFIIGAKNGEKLSRNCYEIIRKYQIQQIKCFLRRYSSVFFFHLLIFLFVWIEVDFYWL